MIPITMGACHLFSIYKIERRQTTFRIYISEFKMKTSKRNFTFKKGLDYNKKKERLNKNKGIIN